MRRGSGDGGDVLDTLLHHLDERRQVSRRELAELRLRLTVLRGRCEPHALDGRLVALHRLPGGLINLGLYVDPVPLREPGDLGDEQHVTNDLVYRVLDRHDLLELGSPRAVEARTIDERDDGHGLERVPERPRLVASLLSLLPGDRGVVRPRGQREVRVLLLRAPLVDGAGKVQGRPEVAVVVDPLLDGRQPLPAIRRIELDVDLERVFDGDEGGVVFRPLGAIRAHDHGRLALDKRLAVAELRFGIQQVLLPDPVGIAVGAQVAAEPKAHHGQPLLDRIDHQRAEVLGIAREQ